MTFSTLNTAKLTLTLGAFAPAHMRLLNFSQLFLLEHSHPLTFSTQLGGSGDLHIATPLHSLSSVAQSRPTLCDPMNRARQASLSITNSRSSLRLTSIESVMTSSLLILCHPLLLLPPIPPSIRVFPMNQLFACGGQSTGASALASFPPKKCQG